MITLGIENLIQNQPRWLKRAHVAILVNQASIDRHFRHTKEVLISVGAKVKAILTPQHGFWGDKQANMDESPDDVDQDYSIPIVSLYSKRREPPMELMEKVDVLIVDLQDVGCRVYTFASTVAYCLKVAGKIGTKVVILDRPNPLGGEVVEGNILAEDYQSFVGMFPIPMKHALTLGELMLLGNQYHGYRCDLEIVPMKGWKRVNLFHECKLPWVLPSPNMPTFDTALVYPGQVLWEGTNISEGRGTTRPFELFGAPFINPKRILECLKGVDLPGVFLRPTAFRPTFDKHRGNLCHGFQIHVTDPHLYKPYRTTLSLLWAVLTTYPEKFEWLPPPYEYEYEKLPIDIITGDPMIRRGLESGKRPDELELQWKARLAENLRMREQYLLYR